MSTSTRHWAHLGENTFVAGTWLLWGVHRVFGRTLFRVCLFPVVIWYWAANPMARAASLQYLQRLQAASGVIGHAPGWRDTLRHFLSFADTLLDKLLAISGRYPFERVRCEGQDAVRRTLASGRGAMIVTAHVGCLELCRALAHHHGGFALTVLVHTAHAERFNRILQRLDPGSRVRLLQVTEVSAATAVLLGECIERGELVAIVGDRVPVRASKTITLPFLGVDAPLPVGAYVLAALLRCPLYFMGCVREAGGHVVVYERLADRVELPRGRRDEALREVAQRYVRSLEAIVRRAPFDWFNFFPFWDQGTTT
ncbi:acyltransferase [Piscinibacter sp.]|jgi:predicted LPLAT superfamily acyltransferase|uniref:LpxL/LpxP family acyltransferase n=1 Tax=Piscinibacter sp. TaxID=1903157 RepID=UPI00355A0B81